MEILSSLKFLSFQPDLTCFDFNVKAETIEFSMSYPVNNPISKFATTPIQKNGSIAGFMIDIQYEIWISKRLDTLSVSISNTGEIQVISFPGHVLLYLMNFLSNFAGGGNPTQELEESFRSTFDLSLDAKLRNVFINIPVCLYKPEPSICASFELLNVQFSSFSDIQSNFLILL